MRLTYGEAWQALIEAGISYSSSELLSCLYMGGVRESFAWDYLRFRGRF